MIYRPSQHDSQNKWVLAARLQEATHQWHRAWSQIPSDTFRVWLFTIVAGWLLTCLIVLASIWLMHSPLTADYRAQETELLEAIISTRTIDPASTNWMDIPGHPLYLLLIILVVFFHSMRAGRFLEGVSINVAFILITLTVGLGWLVWSRDRPDLVLDGAFAPGYNSFPSGHTAQAVTVYGLIAYYWVRHTSRVGEKVFAVLLMTGAMAVVALGRLWIAAHWPSDVLVSIIIGAVFVWTIILAMKKATNKLSHIDEACTEGSSSVLLSEQRVADNS